MKLLFNVPWDNFGLYVFIHNKDQMYFPKMDRIFGSDFIYIEVDNPRMKAKPNGTGYIIKQHYNMAKTHWKAMDTPLKRCRSNKFTANTTQCLTQFLEHNIGCSIGLARSDTQVKR